MTEDVLYATQWNDFTRRPVMRHRWLTQAEAREAYNGKHGVEVVDAVSRDSDGNPVPRWVIGGGASGRVRVSFFTPGGSNWRTIDYDAIDRRLWRWICERDGLLSKATFTDAPVDGFWLDRPAFGDWSNLANPDYGVPTEADEPTPA